MIAIYDSPSRRFEQIALSLLRTLRGGDGDGDGDHGPCIAVFLGLAHAAVTGRVNSEILQAVKMDLKRFSSNRRNDGEVVSKLSMARDLLMEIESREPANNDVATV